MRRRADLEAIYRAGVEAVDPARLTSERLRREGSRLRVDLPGRPAHLDVGRLWIAGAGKAALAMAASAARIAPEVRGAVIIPRGARDRRRRVGGIEVLRGAHPVPDRHSFAAAERLVDLLRARPADDAVLFLLSGGASALLARPAPGISRGDKMRLGRQLLLSGADIELINSVRKHASSIKGGGFLRLAAPRRVVSLVLSDVIGDSLATIGSGPTVPDPTSYRDALVGLERLGMLETIPGSVRARFEAGAAGLADAPETVKPRSEAARRSRAGVIGSNRTALRAAAAEARRRGYRVRVRQAPLTGEARERGAALVRSMRPPQGPTCVLVGGEPTVRVAGSAGRGGRCQEFVVGAMPSLAGGGWALLAAGTDGVDGNSPAAGAVADGTSYRRAGAAAVRRALADHDTYPLLDSLGDAVVTGPSGTNVMDLAILLGGPPPD